MQNKKLRWCLVMGLLLGTLGLGGCLGSDDSTTTTTSSSKWDTMKWDQDKWQ